MRFAISVLLALTLLSPARAADKPVENFTLSDVHNQPWSLADEKTKLVVVAFLGTECPLVKLYGPRLAKLSEQYRDRVAFVAVNANSQDALTKVAAYARQAGLPFPMLKDVGNRVADQFGAERTPEVFVLDERRIVRYRGRIDDQYGVGYTRDEPKRRDLQVALDELLAGQPVSVPKTESVGCHIGRVHQPKANAAVTYSNQIARLFNKRCVECHRSGEIAPFTLDNYDAAAGWADTIAEVVEQERMPPWHASPDHGRFAEDRRLSREEKQLIRDWVAAGAPRGNPADLPEPPKFPAAGWQIAGEPDLVVAMSEKPYVVKAEGEVRYQYFTGNATFSEDKWVRAMEVMPGNRAVVHHSLVHARGAGDGGDGVAGFLAAYVPGLRAKPFPDGMAKRIPAGSRLTFQMHYTPNGSEQRDITKIGLWFADPDKVTHEVRTVSAATRQFAIPPHADNHRVESRSQAAPPNCQILAFMPHMHLRGKAFRYELNNGDQTEILLDIPRYDFNWQTAYRLTEPLEVAPGSFVRAIAHFDNSENNLNNPNPNATVRWGDQTYEEMMIGYFDVAVPRGQARNVGRGLAGRGEFLKRLDKNQDGSISRSEVPEALRGVFDRLSGGRDVLTIDELIRKLNSP